MRSQRAAKARRKEKKKEREFNSNINKAVCRPRRMVVPFFFFAYLDELIVTTSRDAHAIAIGTDAHVCWVLCEFRLWASAPLTSTHTHT